MTKIQFKLLSLIIFLTSCISEKEQNAASKAAAIFNAENCTIGHTKSADTQKGTHNIIVVTLKNPKVKPDKYPMDKTGSISAMTVIQELTKEDYADFDQMKIVVEDNSSSFEKDYEIGQLVNTIPLLNNIQKYFEFSTKKDTLNLKQIISFSDISDSTIFSLINASRQLDSIYGKLNSVNITGFRYDHVTQTNEPLVVAWAETTNGNSVTDYTFYISEKKNKIIFIGINQAE
jgi:hypothetical protein